MKIPFVIDIGAMAIAITAYFLIKALGFFLAHFLNNPSSIWHDGYVKGHNDVLGKIEPDLKILVEVLDKMEGLEKERNVILKQELAELHDRQVSGQKQDL